jgi:phosphatidylinositol-3-phosphatase
MKLLVFVAAFLVIASGAAPRWDGEGTKADEPSTAPLPWPAGLPVYDHVVIVVEENQGYADVLQKDHAPYIKNVLKAEGASFTRMFAEEHPSQGNYFWLFSGSNQNVGFKDQIPGAMLTTPNLGQRLIEKGLAFKGYCEDLPAIGSTVAFAPDPKKGPYARKHAPWVSFANVPNGTTAATSSNLRFADFPKAPAGFSMLPTVAFVIPNLHNDMHNGQPEDAIPIGDRWLKDNIDPYYQWAKKNNSLLILTWDENNDFPQHHGLTNPFVEPTNALLRDIRNRIATIFAGAHIKPGDYEEGKGITHVNILRTLEAMYGLPRSGVQQPNAAGGGIRDDFLITDVFLPAKKN